jgi:NAD(P)-dependent dehydrogenase (short-subunit alcohol dehydrogenase family)
VHSYARPARIVNAGASGRQALGSPDILTPDWIKTARQLTADKGGDWQGYIDALAKENALIGRFATPEEVADFFVFLCSARASYSVGSTYFVDGGMLKAV